MNGTVRKLQELALPVMQPHLALATLPQLQAAPSQPACARATCYVNMVHTQRVWHTAARTSPAMAFIVLEDCCHGTHQVVRDKECECGALWEGTM